MTRLSHSQASLTDLPGSPAERLGDPRLDEASRRAWTRPMTVSPFGDGYLVDAGGDTHYVSLGPSNCSCRSGPDRGPGGRETGERETGERETDEHGTGEGEAGEDGVPGDGRTEGTDPGDAVENLCEHVRRVAIEINLGRVPPPSARTVECGECGRAVDVSAADSPPPLCPECALEPGDVVVDARADGETPLLVVSEPGRPADRVAVPADGRTVARYADNEPSPPDTPVVEVVYPRSVSPDRDPRRYLFPLARLRRPDGDPRPPERDDGPCAPSAE